MTVTKRFWHLAVCALMILAMALPAYATEAEPVKEALAISTVEEFLAFAENCRLDTYSQNVEVSLECDIDLSGVDFAGVPIFSGTFDGNSHIIKGFDLTAEGSAQGLFRYLTEDAVVRDLFVEGNIYPGGSAREVGAIAGCNEGQILNCSFSGSLSGTEYVGGIAGRNGVSGVIENCRVQGDVHGSHFVGGIVGQNSGVIRVCRNRATVNTTPQQNTVELADVRLESLTNTEAVNTVTDIGGIAGISSGVIRDCENRADVGYRHMGYNIGGIAGTQSGYITDCENYGIVHGRKEVGGIVGQMEPVSIIEYTEDTLQILRQQLGTMTGLVNRVSGNAQANAAGIGSQIGNLQNQAETATDAVSALFPKGDRPELPDADAILAAQNTLTTTLNAMPKTLRGIASATQATVTGLSRDLGALSNQISAMSATLNDASENLGGSITDISDQDTPEQLSGKVEACVNTGEVLADMNAGGIAGAMAVENDLDVLEDWEQQGENSMNFNSQLRAVVLRCENRGTVTAKHQNAGGIAGWQMLGLIKDSVNTGALESAEADHVGGISGLSTGYIRACGAKGMILGKTYVGGIAGSAAVVSDSLSQVRIEGAREKQGAVLGYTEENTTEEEIPIRNNYYMCTQEDLGAVDGISYTGLAEPMEQEAFLALEQLPDVFQSVTVSFWQENGEAVEIRLQPGERLDLDDIPEVRQKTGYAGWWKDLEETDLDDLFFDKSFYAAYRAYSTVIESSEIRPDGRPMLLVEGAFTDAAAVQIEKTDVSVNLEDDEILLESWEMSLTEAGSVAHFLLPEDADKDHLKLMAGSESGKWRAVDAKLNGSYLVFSLEAEDRYLALVEDPVNYLVWVAAGIGAVVFLLLGIVLAARKRKKKTVSKEA